MGHLHILYISMCMGCKHTDICCLITHGVRCRFTIWFLNWKKKKKAVNLALLHGWLFTLCGHHMFTLNLLDACQLYSCSLKIIHRSPSYPGGATGSWGSGSAKTPNWQRRSAAARSQRGQMPLLMYHVFQAGQQCVLCVSCSGRGEKGVLAKTFSHWCQPDTCLCTPHGLRYHLILSHRSVGVLSLPFSSHAVLCQVWSWRLIAAAQPFLSGGLFRTGCWQQAIATECQFLLTTLYNYVF